MAEQRSIFGKNFVIFSQSKQKRKNTRVRMDIPCKIYSSGYPDPINGVLIELGMGGLKFQSGALHYAEDRVELEFSLLKKTINISGVILRISGKNAVLKIGNLSDEIKETVQDYIYHFYVNNMEDKKAKNAVKLE
ncbi:MAG: PilZ domain-containing protein [Leptospiraceae bacterium]|nr:PilZ domain-containing protein [Leptospiraceae bacterium]MCP5498137.1 PilZ domain-containing protein [Leptospiraceae bacterium]